jgi:hypothetical protein
MGNSSHLKGIQNYINQSHIRYLHIDATLLEESDTIPNHSFPVKER